jgi:hypothetical protein
MTEEPSKELAGSIKQAAEAFDVLNALLIENGIDFQIAAPVPGGLMARHFADYFTAIALLSKAHFGKR